MARLPVMSLGLLSAAALAYELLLMRLFSIIHWHHFAYMVIGLALLGHAFSGSMVLVMQKRLLTRFHNVYLATIMAFSLFSVASFIAAQNVPFNAEEILWDGSQSFYLLIIFLLLSVPFFFVGTAICLAFLFFKQRLATLYAADLLGAGLGCLGFVLLLYLVFPDQALFFIAVGGLLAAAVAVFELSLPKIHLISIVVLTFVLQWGTTGFQLKLSPYKSLPRMELINGTRVVTEKSSPLGWITVLASDVIPFRYAPGMSLNSGSEPLPQLGIFIDADNMTTITQQPESLQQLAYLDQMSSALAYHLHPIDNVLIIGSGGGTDVLQAKYHRVNQVDAVELNPQVVDLTEIRDGNFRSDVYRQPGVSVHIADGRDFLNTHRRTYELIQLNLLDSFNAAAAGLYALNESYLYTEEALRLFLSHLRPGGYLSITRWIKMPPRDSLKLFNTVLAAVPERGDAKQRMLLIRSWQTATLIVKNGVFSEQEIAAANAFNAQRNFDWVYAPGIEAEQVNRFNILREPLFYSGTQALLGSNRANFVERYKFNLQPPTDDRPYFQHFFRWSSLPEMLGLLGKGGASLIESGYLVIFATLCIAIFSSVVLILGPLYWLPNDDSGQGQCRVDRRHVCGYFFAIGLGFLMIEIAFMQKFILFLHDPVFAASATLTAFLIFAGFGSAFSADFTRCLGRRKTMTAAVIGIVVLSMVYLLILPEIFKWGSDVSLMLRFLIVIIMIAPLAFFMGMPMPLALSSLAEYGEPLIPWAWGINGCASVVSSVLAALLSMQFGFSAVIQTAVVLYAAVILIFPEPQAVHS